MDFPAQENARRHAVIAADEEGHVVLKQAESPMLMH